MEKITKREVFECLLNMALTGESTYTREDGTEISLDEDFLADFARHEIELLDKKTLKAKNRAASKKACNDELTEIIFANLSNEFEPIAEIAARIEDEDVTVAKVTYRLTQLVKNGRAEKQEITIPATETSKARKVQGYRILISETED